MIPSARVSRCSVSSGKAVGGWLAGALAVAVFGLLPAGDAAAQKDKGPTPIRNVEEPARVPYFHSVNPQCPFGNLCEVKFPAVEPGKRLRVTFISGFVRNVNASGFAALNLDIRNNPLQYFPVSPLIGAFYGNIFSFNEAVDVYFEAGQSPHLEIGIPAGSGPFTPNPANRLTVSGYVVDVAP